MYAAGPVTGGGATLAATGLGMGSWVLAVAGVIFVGVGLWTLVRKNSKNRP
jgi:LPXTG-motif cell wall-anchored protein